MLGSRNRNSVQSNSWIGNLPNFMTSSLSRKSSFSRPTYQCSRPPSPPRSSMQQFSYPAASQVGQCEDGFRSPHVPPKGIPVKDYKYQEPVYSRITDVRATVPVTDMLEKEVCDQGKCFEMIAYSLNCYHFRNHQKIQVRETSLSHQPSQRSR